MDRSAKVQMLRTMRPAGRGTESAIAIFEQPSHIDGNPRVGKRCPSPKLKTALSTRVHCFFVDPPRASYGVGTPESTRSVLAKAKNSPPEFEFTTFSRQPGRSGDASRPAVLAKSLWRRWRLPLSAYRREFACAAQDAFGLRGSKQHTR